MAFQRFGRYDEAMMVKHNIRSYSHAIAYCLKFSWEASRLYFVIRLFLLVVTALLPYVSLFISKIFIDNLTFATSHRQTGFIILLIVLSTAIVLLSRINSLIMQYILTVQEDTLSSHMDKRIMEKTLTMDMAYFDSPCYLNTMQVVMTDFSAISNIIWNIFYGVSSLLSLVVATLMLLEYSWLFTIVIVIASAPMAVADYRYAKILYEWHLDNIDEERKKSYVMSIASDKRYAADVRLFGLRDSFISRYQKLWDYLFHGRKKLQKKQLLLSIVTSMFPDICTLVFLISLTISIIDGHNTIGDYVLFSGLFASLTAAMIAAIAAFTSVYDNRLRVETIQKFESQENSVPDKGTIELSDKEDICVEFINVCFAYPDTERFVINNLSFKINAMEKVCLIGVNGSGKSTIIKLLLRFYDVSKGQILINHLDIKEYTISSLRRCFSTFFQESAIYAFSLAENVSISDNSREATDSNVMRALEAAGADDMLMKLPGGIKSYIGRIFDLNGYEPSGGEAQKIALARAIYRCSRFVIFDEPSSSLDPEAEALLFDNMSLLWKNKTAFFTSHRLAAVHISDRIVLLDNGCILEQGTHKELMKNKGRYAQLYKLQASKYTDSNSTHERRL